MRGYQGVTIAILLVTLVGGCTEADPTLPQETDNATIVGRVAQTLGGGIASTAVILASNEEGESETVTLTAVGSSGFYQLGSVPTGRDDLVVHIEGEAGGILGSVLVQERTRQGSTVTVAPADIETTLEFRVLQNVDPSGPAGTNIGGLMAFVRAGGQVSEIIANSPVEVLALADAWVAFEGALTGSFARLDVDLDLAARTEHLVEAASDYAELRHAGVSAASAHPLFTADMLAAFQSAGASEIDLVVASAAAATAAMHTSGLPAPATELIAVRQVALINLQARQRLLSDVLDVEGASQTLLALQVARAAVEAASTPEQVVERMTAASNSAGQALEDLFLDLASHLNATARLRIRIALEEALDEANLTARLVGRVNATQIIPVVADYEDDVRVAAADATFQLPVSVGTEAFVKILVAASGGGWLSR